MTFASYLAQTEALYLEASGQAAPVLSPLESVCPFRSKKIVIVAPHPDDECLMSGFALRAKVEWDAQVYVIPFSYGSDRTQRERRSLELENALAKLNFERLDPRADSEREELDVSALKNAFATAQADTFIFPHRLDGHPAHVRCAEKSRQALAQFAPETNSPLHLLLSEYWSSQAESNLLIPLSRRELLKMGEGLLAHAGEVARNPYHLSLPAWCIDQVRRGSEIKKGSGTGDFIFGQLYRYERVNTS